MIEIKGKNYDDTMIQDPYQKLKREFYLTALTVVNHKMAIEDHTKQKHRMSPFENAVFEMVTNGQIDLERIQKDRKYLGVMLSVFLSRLLTPEDINKSNDKTGSIWPLGLYEIDTTKTAKKVKKTTKATK